jgi:TM2 domain
MTAVADPMEQPAREPAVALDGTPYRDESRSMKVAGLALVALSLGGFLWLTVRAQDGALLTLPAAQLVVPALVLAVTVNVLAVGMLVLAAGLGRRDEWRDARRRRAALLKLACANLLLPAIAFTLLQDNPVIRDASDADLWWLALPALVAYAVIYGGIALLRRGWRVEATRADEAVRDDPRPPVVYLRSFADDGHTTLASDARSRLMQLLAGFATTSPEQELTFVLRRVGPVLAIGKPGEPLPELGAARLYVAHDRWQQTVTELMQRAALVVLRIGNSAGIQWEIDQALALVPRERCVFVLLGEGLPAQRLEQATGVVVPLPAAPTGWRRWVEVMFSNPSRRLGTVVCFDASGRPHVESVRLWPRHKAELLLLLMSSRPAAAPLRDAFRAVFAHQGRPWVEPPQRGTAVALALTLGVLGAHWFYLGERRRALRYAFGFFLVVPTLLAWRDALRWMLMDRRSFDRWYGQARQER